MAKGKPIPDSSLAERYFDLVEVIIVALDTEGTVTLVNRKGCEILGCSREEIVGRDWFEEFVPRRVRAEVLKVFRNIIENKNENLVYYENPVLNRAGEERIIAWHNSLLKESTGHPMGTLSSGVDITRQRAAESSLRENEERFRYLFETMAQGVIYQAADGRIVAANPSALKILGLAEDQILGKTFSDIRWRSIREDGSEFSAEDHPSMVALRTGQAVLGAVMGVFNPREERYRWIVLNAIPQFRVGVKTLFQVYTCFHDFTDRKQSEEKLRLSEEKLQKLVEQSIDGILICDADGRIVEWNPVLERISGLQKAEVLGKPLDEIVSTFAPSVRFIPAGQDDLGRYVNELFWNTAANWLNTNLEVEIERGESETTFLLVIPFAIQTAGSTLFMVIARDVTAQKRTELAFHALTEYLETVRERERTDVSREIHDELGQVLTAIRMDIRWIFSRLTGSPPGVSERLRQMDTVIGKAMEAVHRISSSLRPAILDDLGLMAAVEWEAAEFQKHSGIPCAVRIEGEDLSIPRDTATAMFRILQEALTNAARHAKATRLEVSLSVGQRMIELCVRDDGRGIPAGRIADPHSFGLTGMRERARRIGGACEIAAQSGGGTTVRARIPLGGKA